GRPARDAAERERGARAAAPGRGAGHGVDLRLEPRLRDNQRRLPLLTWTTPEPLRGFPPLSHCCAMRAGGRPQRGGAALARGLLTLAAPGSCAVDACECGMFATYLIAAGAL